MKWKTKFLLVTASLCTLVQSAEVVSQVAPGKNDSDPAQKVAVEEPPAQAGRALGVCPPFMLFDEDGNVIEPVKGANADKPYSPKQTCGKCHDYDKIT
ncbi:MAG: hypothetical protein JXA81_13365 [Sedimentisphaerales bacterium]|nr:hypothetical protein [Sedimentisphaerales bacterium]